MGFAYDTWKTSWIRSSHDAWGGSWGRVVVPVVTPSGGGGFGLSEERRRTDYWWTDKDDRDFEELFVITES